MLDTEAYSGLIFAHASLEDQLRFTNDDSGFAEALEPYLDRILMRSELGPA